MSPSWDRAGFDKVIKTSLLFLPFTYLTHDLVAGNSGERRTQPAKNRKCVRVADTTGLAAVETRMKYEVG